MAAAPPGVVAGGPVYASPPPMAGGYGYAPPGAGFGPPPSYYGSPYVHLPLRGMYFDPYSNPFLQSTLAENQFRWGGRLPLSQPQVREAAGCGRRRPMDRRRASTPRRKATSGCGN